MTKLRFGLVLVAALMGWGTVPAMSQQSGPATQCVTNALAGGTNNALTTAMLPCVPTTTLLLLTLSLTSTSTAPTLQPVGAQAQVITHSDGTALDPGELMAGDTILLNNNGNRWQKLSGPQASLAPPHASTLAVMRTFPAVGTLYRDGYYAEGDGGGAFYVFDPTASCSDDGGSCVAPNVGVGKWVADFNGAPASVQVWGVKCDGTTDDSVNMQLAFTGYGNLVLPPGGESCLIAGVVAGDKTTLDCQGSGLKAAPAASLLHTPMFKRTGKQRLLHCYVEDPDNNTLVTTSLASGASPGASSIAVLSATGLAIGMPIGIELDSGAHFVTRISNVVGTTVSLNDAVPSSATSVAINSGGVGGYSVNDPLVALGGVGAPLTLKVTSVDGSNKVTGVVIQAPGKYNTIPASALSVSDTKTNGVTAQGATFTPTYAGASSGKSVKAAWGLITSVGADEGTIDDLRSGFAPVAMAYYPAVAGQSEGEYLNNFRLNGSSLVGIFKDTSVNTLIATNGFVWGTQTAGLPTGYVGIYVNGENPTSFATGGNNFVNVNVLQSEVEWQLNSAQLDNLSVAIADTTKYYGLVCNACQNLIINDAYASFSGPGLPSVSGYGIGVVMGGGSLNVSLGGLMAGLNASDLHLDASSSSVFLTNMSQAFGPALNITGNGASLLSGQAFMNVNTGATPVGGSGATPIYLGQSTTPASATEIQVVWRNPLYVPSRVSDFVFSVPVAPGAGNSYTGTLRINATDSPVSCVIANAATSCEVNSPIVVLAPGDAVSVKVVSSASAAASQMFVWGRVN